MTIIVVRHGETAGNVGAVIQRPEVPLNERGLLQAARVAKRLAAAGYTHIVSSDLARARMTAQALHELSGLAVEESPLLQERNFGDLRGTPYAALDRDPFGPDFAPPNGETWDLFHERVALAFAWILDRRRELAGPLVVVTHGLVCRALVQRHVLPLQPDLVVPDRFQNTSVTILDANSPHAVRTLNCVAHLEEPGTAARQGSAV